MMLVDIKKERQGSENVVMVIGDYDPVEIGLDGKEITDDMAELISRKLLQYPEIEVKIDMGISMKTRISIRRILETHKIPYDSYHVMSNGDEKRYPNTYVNHMN